MAPDKLKRWLSSRRQPLPSFRFLFTMMYLGVIGSIAYFNTLLNCGRQFLGGGDGVLAIIFLLLAGLEQLEHRRYRYEAPMSIAVVLPWRGVPFQAVAALDCGILSILLFPIIPFSAYFALRCDRQRACSSLFYAGLAVVMTWRHNPDWYLNPMTTYVLIAFVLSLFFMHTLVCVIQRDEANRRVR